MALSRNYVADLNDPGTRSRWERSTQRGGQDPTKNPYYRAATGGPAVEPIKTGVATSDPYYGGMAQAKPLMASDSMAKPMQMPSAPPSQVSGMADQLRAFRGGMPTDGYSAPTGDFAGALGGGSYQGMDSTPLAGSTPFGLQSDGKPSQSGATMLDKPTGMSGQMPTPMPQQGGAGWNDISRYQRTSGAGDSGRGGMPGPSIGNPRGIVNRLSPGGPETVGGALVGRALGNSRNNQRYAQAAASSRQANAQQNQIQQLTANGRTYDQALDELGLRGNPQWDASARVSRPRQGPRELPGGGDRYGRYQP